MPAPRKPVCAEKQASEGRAIKPAPQRVAGFPPRPFLSGGGVGGRVGGGSVIINALMNYLINALIWRKAH